MSSTQVFSVIENPSFCIQQWACKLGRPLIYLQNGCWRVSGNNMSYDILVTKTDTCEFIITCSNVSCKNLQLFREDVSEFEYYLNNQEIKRNKIDIYENDEDIAEYNDCDEDDMYEKHQIKGKRANKIFMRLSADYKQEEYNKLHERIDNYLDFGIDEGY